MQTLVELIAQRIRASDGWIGADDLMQIALYSPGLGYYTGGGQPFAVAQDPYSGRGDFVTAPMLGPWLAEAIVRWATPLWPCLSPSASGKKCIREFGAGRGDLAAALLARGEFSMELIEVSGGLRQLQAKTTEGLGTIVWRDELAPGFAGLVIANEVLDAMPVKCFEWIGDDQVLEWGVALGSGADADAPLRWQSRPATDPMRQAVLIRSQAAAARGWPWPVGYRGEWCPWTTPWIRAVADSMTCGAVLLIDYGAAQPELDHPGRSQGSLAAHYQHQRFDHPQALLDRLGRQDLTAHVNFSHVAQAAQDAGLAVSGFVTQSRFILESGLMDHAQTMIDAITDPIARVRALQSFQTLVMESEMGEVFKCLLLTKGLPPATVEQLTACGFAGGDRRESLWA